MKCVIQSEHEEQVALFKWWEFACHSFGLNSKCLFAIPNGGKRDVVIAKRLKQEGVKSGIPDIFLAVPREGKHGLFIELKKKKGGKVSENQKICISLFSALEYKAIVCNGWLDAKEEIEEYLRSDDERTPNVEEKNEIHA